ncbi:amino acid ABC transporter substrate-binding protein, PAAT family [Rhizobium sp. RU35A]|nr:amino acid ABC transporter substrate-binding protein, PAAT family [Rhizobium sp. RU35A]
MQNILLLLAMILMAGAPVARAQTSEMPVLFDADERLGRPDLSTLPRLRVLTTVDFPPFSFVDQTGRLSGFHLDLVREICRELAIEAKCQVQAIPFADLEAALDAGEGEAVAAGIAVTPALRERFAFSRPYITIPARFARNREVDLKGKAADALAGRSVGVVKDTVHQAMLASFFPKLRAVPFADQSAMLDALKAKTIDAAFSDGLRLPFWVAGEASGQCCALYDGPYLSERFLGEGLMLMTRKNTPQLAEAFDYALAQLARKGRLQDIYLRYFPNGFY